MSGVSDTDRTALAAEAYVYGFPLVFDLQEVSRQLTTGFGPLPATAANTFGHARDLADATATFVSVNNDTLYSIANLDLSGGPVLLRVPDTGDRYYVLQFVDAWTNNFAYVGRRATGTAAGAYLIVPPGWSGEAPADAKVIHAPTTIATMVGRVACAGVADLPAVHEVQAGLTVTPLDPDAARTGIPDPVVVPEELAFWERLRTWLQAFPPSEADAAYQQRFAPLGLLDPVSPYTAAPEELRAALVAGQAAGTERIEHTGLGGAAPATGWAGAGHSFDYNDSFFEVGTRSDAAWRIADRPTAFVTRAVAARQGLWGNHGYEAFYAGTFTDADGEPLHGANRYELRFDETPPVDAFWSITMYDLPQYFLVANPIGRYSIGDRTPGLQPAADGSLTLLLQADEPATDEERARWLPTPRERFRPLLRAYQPGAAMLDGSYVIPPIRRVDHPV